MSKPVYAWHFVGATLRDGTPIPSVGVKLVWDKEVIPCQQGYHASIDPFDALKYAPGETLCLVKCGGVIKYHNNDKLACSERTIVAQIDANNLLRSFARKCALDVVHLWSAPAVVVDYLTTGNESLRDAARAAAQAAAWDAARDAAWDAAWDAARATAWAAARDAARATAWAAARAAARATAWAAARAAAQAAAQAAAWDAARAAARDAAWDAARDATRVAVERKQRSHFNDMVTHEFSSFLCNLD